MPVIPAGYKMTAGHIERSCFSGKTGNSFFILKVE